MWQGTLAGSTLVASVLPVRGGHGGLSHESMKGEKILEAWKE